jgi:TRAP-type C4-dicarboxylate transport system permease small subunit
MKKFLNIYYKVDDVIEVFIRYLCALLLTIMIVVCFTNTVCRYFLGFSFKWAEEIVRYAAVWVTCVGASLTAREDDHVTMDLLQESIKNPKVKAVCYALTRFIACLFLLLLMPAAFEMVNIYKAAFSTGAHMPQWILYISYPIGSIAMVLGYLRITPPKVKKIWTDTVEKTEFDLINEGVIE